MRAPWCFKLTCPSLPLPSFSFRKPTIGLVCPYNVCPSITVDAARNDLEIFEDIVKFVNELKPQKSPNPVRIQDSTLV